MMARHRRIEEKKGIFGISAFGGDVSRATFLFLFKTKSGRGEVAWFVLVPLVTFSLFSIFD
jgi:hypothetical protein